MKNKKYHLASQTKCGPTADTKEEAYERLLDTKDDIRRYFKSHPIENNFLDSYEINRVFILIERKCQRCQGEFIPEYEGDRFCSKTCLHKTLRWKVLNRDNFQCQYCGATPADDAVKLEIDHIKPKVDGGIDEIDNLVTACKPCNRAKYSMPLRYEYAFKRRVNGPCFSKYDA